MRISGFSVLVSAALLLSGCANADGSKQNPFKEFYEWTHGRPSTFEKHLDRAPTGYAGQNPKRGILKPPAVVEAERNNWQNMDGYDAAAAHKAVAVTDGVTVYPLDGAAYDPNFTPSYQYEQPVSGYMPLANDDYGQLVQRLYFAHGSSAIRAADKKSLRSIVQDLRASTSMAAITVVGHASQRVDGVTDPVRRKMVNFEMAQKRANAVTQELTLAGIEPQWVQVVSKGEEQPNTDLQGKTQEAADRRVELFVQ